MVFCDLVHEALILLISWDARGRWTRRHGYEVAEWKMFGAALGLSRSTLGTAQHQRESLPLWRMHWSDLVQIDSNKVLLTVRRVFLNDATRTFWFGQIPDD